MIRFWGILGRYALVWLVYLLALLLATSLFPGMYLDTSAPHWWVVALTVPVEFALLVILLRPLLLFLTLPLNALTLGVPTLLFNALILKWTADVNATLVITSYHDALLAVLLMTAVATSVIGWLGLDEAYPLLQTVLYRIGRRWGPRRAPGARRGLLLVQIDGLSDRSLIRALKRGSVPTLSALLASGSHRLHRWSSGLPSNTPAVQAGMLYGLREDVPGYRWYDRREQVFKVVSSSATARELEQRLEEDGPGPLLAGGSCISSLLSGGADKRLLTVSAMSGLRQAGREEQVDLNLFYLSPTAYTGALLAGAWDYLSGLTLGTIGLLRRRRPRLQRHPLKLAQSGMTNAVLRHASFFWLRQDIVRGVPVIYSNFVGYDDVAHYSGPDDYEAMIALAAFDRGLRKLRRFARRQGGLEYDLVVLSDHGQTASIPFRHLYGASLGQVVADIVGQVVDQGASAGDAAYLDTLLHELATGVQRRGWAMRRGERTLQRIRDHRGSGADQESRADRSHPGLIVSDAGAELQIAVCVSGCLAHLYVRGEPERLTLERLRVQCPGLVSRLLAHPGVGFAVALLDSGEPVALGAHGVRNLDTGEVADQDPLAGFGDPHLWAPELARLARGANSGDIILNGAWLEDRDRVVVFEEQTSSHGGLGGPQTAAFVLLPTAWDVPMGEIDGPEAIYRELRRHGSPVDDAPGVH
ncbi:hypothetical protein GF314_15645 [bacterium]|nr:hypothetical protein [bacterium]